MKELLMESTDENLAKLLDVLNEELERAGCDIDTQYELDIAVEEIYVNISDYAYGGSTGPVSIKLDIGDGAVITFADEGMPFDPLKKEEPDITLPGSKRPIGGLGIFLVKKSMDEMVYRYEEGKNILTIKKKWRASGDQPVLS